MNDDSLLDLIIPLRVAVTAPRGLLIVPLWFEPRQSSYWCASQADSLLVRALGEAPHCAFDLSTNDMPYRGLRGRGEVRLHPELGAQTLESLLLRYLGSLHTPLARRLMRRAASETAIEIVPQWQSQWDFTARMKSSLPRRAP